MPVNPNCLYKKNEKIKNKINSVKHNEKYINFWNLLLSVGFFMIFFHRASSVKTLNPRTGMNISNIFNEKTVKFMIPVSKFKKLKISYEKKYKTQKIISKML